jgi:hypothetical protein
MVYVEYNVLKGNFFPVTAKSSGLNVLVPEGGDFKVNMRLTFFGNQYHEEFNNCSELTGAVEERLSMRNTVEN